MKVDRLQCDSCGASFDFAEKIGTTSMYVKHCPHCGAGSSHFHINRADSADR